jgi:hypothetical protein
MRYWSVTSAREPEFLSKGFKRRHVFSHTLHYLPKAGPGALRFSGPMCGITNPTAQWEILLHATSPRLDEVPRELFFDDDIVWHKRQYGMDGHVAFGFVAVDADRMFGLNYVSDVVQRISRRRELKTRIETVLRGWTYMLLNGLLNFAVEMRIRTFFSPTAELIMQNSRPAQPELFERIYDHTPGALFEVRRRGPWWVVDVEANRHRLVRPEPRTAPTRPEATLCLVHDLSARDVGARPAVTRPSQAIRLVEDTTRVVKGLGCPVTFIVPRALFDEVRGRVAGEEHALGFASDHALVSGELGPELVRCRGVDQRTKGYRLADARPAELQEALELCYHKFDWLLVAGSRANRATLGLERGVVNIPISLDDHALAEPGCDTWASQLEAIVNTEPPAVVSLGTNWSRLDLDGRRRLLERVARPADLKTCDQLTEAFILSRAF